MKTLMVIAGDAFDIDVAPEPGNKVYLRSYDADTPDGRGAIVTTTVRDEALRFDDLAAAFECWKRTSATRPLRPDGKPNRPLTAYTITFETVAE